MSRHHTSRKDGENKQQLLEALNMNHPVLSPPKRKLKKAIEIDASSI